MENNESPLRNINPNIEDDNIDHIRLQKNDPSLTSISITSLDDDEYSLFPHDDDWEKAGECIGRNEHLRLLCLSLDEMPKIKSLCRGLKSNTSISELEICTDFCDGFGYRELAPFLERNVIEFLMISHDDETEANRSSQRLAWALTRFTSLRDFEIQSACILDEVLQQVIKGLYGHSKLRYIGLFGIDQRHTSRSFSILATLLQNPDSQLEELTISEPEGLDYKRMSVLAVALAANTAMKKLKITFGYKTTNAGFMSLCHVLQSPQTRLEHLSLTDLFSADLKDEDLVLLINALSNNTHLVSLVLDDNTETMAAGGVFWHALCEYFQSRKCMLQHLSLSRSMISDHVATPLITSLMGNETLTSLDISHNRITNTSWRALSTVFSQPTCVLEKVGIHGNSFDDDSAHLLANSLSRNHRLRQLDLAPCPNISASGWLAFAQILYQKSDIMATYHSNCTLHSLTSWGAYTISEELSLALKINEECDRRDAAHLKIIKCIFDEDYDVPLNDMKPNILPSMMAWLGRSINQIDEVKCDAIGLSLVYQAIRASPSLFSFLGKTKKRKLMDY